MRWKYFFLGLAALLICQISADERGLIESVINKINGIFSKIKNIIEDSIISMAEKLSKIVADISSTGNKLIERALESIKEEIDKDINTINKWIGIAKENTVDATECVGENIEILKDLPNTTLKDLKTCLNSNLELAQGLIEDSVAQIREFLGDIEDLASECRNCGLHLVCLTKVSVSASTLLVTIPGRISAVIINSSLTLVNIGKDIATCIADTVAQVILTAVSISTETMKCIQGKIGAAEFHKIIYTAYRN